MAQPEQVGQAEQVGQVGQAGQTVQRIKQVVTRWEASKPDQPAHPIMGDIVRVWQIVAFTGQWPDSIIKSAERLGYELPEPHHDRVEEVQRGLFQRRMELTDTGNDLFYKESAEQYAQMTDQEKLRFYPDGITIVYPEVNQALGRPFMPREMNLSLWVDGELRNRYVPAGMRVLFRSEERVIEIPLQPMPKPPAEAREWPVGRRWAWNKETLAGIPKRVITVICEYGSRRCLEGEPVLDHEGQVVRHRIAGEWIRESVAYLPGTPSPFFFDDRSNQPTPSYRSLAREFRQEVADVAFVLMHQ